MKINKVKGNKPVKYDEKRATIVVMLVLILSISMGMLAYYLMSFTSPHLFALLIACGLSSAIGSLLTLKEIKAWRVYENK